MSLDSLELFRYTQPRVVDVEDVEKYAPGGYHPVDIGDTIHTGGRSYEVIHKLGHGGFSTVWLVRLDAPSSPYFALKVLCSDVGDIPDGELRILQHLGSVAGPGHPNVLALRDSFTITGPNGEHRCLVFPVLGPSLQTSNVQAAMSSNTRHQVCQQVASAMAFLHHHGVCHGDLTLSNVVFELPDFQAMSPARVSQLLGPVKGEKLRLPNGQCSPHAPKQVIEALKYSGIDYSLLTRVQIVDFGQAYFVDGPPKSLGVPIDFFPPEICFGYLPSTQSDVWQLACALYQIHTGKFLFPTFFRIFEALVGTVIGYLGPIPRQWQGKFNFEEYGYMEPGRERLTIEPEWWFQGHFGEHTIESRLSQEAAHLSVRQREDLIRLLYDMVVYEPGKRLSAVDVSRCLNPVSQLSEEPVESTSSD